MFNSTTINLILSMVLTAVMGTGYYFWKQSVEESALNKLHIIQLEQEVKSQAKYIDDLQVLNREGNQLIAELKDKQIVLNNRLKELDAYLDSQPKDQKESSEVLKRTIKELSQ